MTTTSEMRADEVLGRLLTDGYAVVERVLDDDTVADLQHRIQRLLDTERAQPYDGGDVAVEPPATGGDWYTRIWDLDDDERRRLARRQAAQRRDEFDTPWPVPDEDVCINFIHIPTQFDSGRSQRVFNLINKDTAVAPLLEHPVVMRIVEDQLGRDAILLDVSVNAVGPHTPDGGWHVDSPLTQLAEPLPPLTSRAAAI
jgi:hypothetical protein